MRTLLAILFLGVFVVAGTAWGASVHVAMHKVDKNGTGELIGTIEFQDTPRGLLILPNLHGLSPGQHGIHVHQNPNCGPADRDGTMVPGLAAGGHYDPQNTGRHAGPMGNGHLGDLPVLHVDAQGNAAREMYAYRLDTEDLAGRAIVIHAGGDNYSDSPQPLGGGGARVACGVIGG